MRLLFRRSPLLLLALVLPAAATAQEGELFFDTVDVEVVNVEVVVTDKKGNPVRGLTLEDFEVLEDGRPVEVTNFFAVEGRVPVVVGSGDGALLPAERAPTPETERLHLVVFIDNLNLRPQSRKAVFNNLRRYLTEQLDSRDRVMLVTMNDTVEVAQAFTNNTKGLTATLDLLERDMGRQLQFDARHRRLLTELERAQLVAAGGGGGLGVVTRDFDAAVADAGRLASDVRNFALQRYQKVTATLDALQRFCSSLAGMKGRKALLYVSEGIHQRPADSLARSWLNKFEEWVLQQDATELLRDVRDLTMLAGSSELDASDQLDELVAHASGNGVTFYPLAPGGHLSGGGISAEFSGSLSAGGRSPVGSDVVALERQSLEGSILLLAEGTGGIAFTGNTNISGLLERMIGDFETFYSLGYRPPGEREAERLHDIVVRVRRPDVVVRHLGGIRKKDPLERLQERTLSAVHYGIVDNPLGVVLEPGDAVLGESKRYRLPVLIKIPFEKILLLPQEGHHTGKVTLVVIVRDMNTGGVSEPQLLELPIQVPNDKILQVLAGTAAYPLNLELRTGRKRISVGVRDQLARIESTVNLEVRVGDGRG